MTKIGLYVMGINHTIDKYYQILTLLRYMSKNSKEFEIKILVEETPGKVKRGIADKDLYTCLKDEFEFIDLSKFDINSLGLSAVFVIDPYSVPKTPYRDIKVPIIYKEYGVAGIEAGTGYLISKPIYRYARLIITESEFTRQMILDKYPDKDVVVGSPAFDYIYDTYHEDPRFEKGKYHVLWTPHHSMESKPSYDVIEGGTYSTFLTYKDYLTGEFLRQNPNIVLHIKYHPILPKRYSAYCKSHGIDDTFSRYLKRTSTSRIRIHPKEDYHSLFMHSDLCLNDSISFTLEWSVTGKPMIVLEDSSKSRYSDYGESLIDNNPNYYRASCTDEVNHLVHDLQNRTEISDFPDDLFIKKGRPNCESLVEEILKRIRKEEAYA